MLKQMTIEMISDACYDNTVSLYNVLFGAVKLKLTR